MQVTFEGWLIVSYGAVVQEHRHRFSCIGSVVLHRSPLLHCFEGSGPPVGFLAARSSSESLFHSLPKPALKFPLVRVEVQVRNIMLMASRRSAKFQERFFCKTRVRVVKNTRARVPRDQAVFEEPSVRSTGSDCLLTRTSSCSTGSAFFAETCLFLKGGREYLFHGIGLSSHGRTNQTVFWQ